jgi:hypothetical protein
MIGSMRSGYDWRRHTVSSLGAGRRGWLQRADFILTGVLYSLAARGLRQCPPKNVGSRAIPVLVAAAGIGLIGSGGFVTDPMGGFPPMKRGEDGHDDSALSQGPSTRDGTLHNICGVPIFSGIPLAGLVSAVAATRRREYRWACYSALSSFSMVGSFVMMGRAFGGVPRSVGKGGIFQRISIAFGFGRLTALSLRARSSLPKP